MSAFMENTLTYAGLRVIAKGITGEPVRFTRIVMGDGLLAAGQDARALKGVISPRAELDIKKLVLVGDGTVVVGGVFQNAPLAQGFFFRELALYAEDPDPQVGEIMYCYGNSGELAEWIPPGGGQSAIEKTIDILTIIGVATNVSAYINADAYATKEDLANCLRLAQDAKDTADRALLRADEAYAMGLEALNNVLALRSDVAVNTSQLVTLWDAVFATIREHPFQIRFNTLNNIALSAGNWNEPFERIEC